MTSSPFNLYWGDSVWAKVSATNEKGTSSQSNAGNGAIIITRADPPVNLAEDSSQRNHYTIAITWEAGAFEGGTPVIDYKVNIAEQGQAATVLIEGVTTFTATATGLTPGVFYEFTVNARNEYDFSYDS